MQDTSQVNPACDLRAIREAVCVHTDKITDSCLAKDCIEDLHVYLTVDSQHALDCSNAARARFVELLHVGVQVEAVPFNTGNFAVDVTFFYRIIADASVSAGRPVTITGLGIFSKRMVLFGGETSAKVFSSRMCKACLCKQSIQSGSLPQAVVEVVDPIILGSRVQDVCACNCCCTADTPQIPDAILECFDNELVLSGECKRLLVTIGQFSITRLERDTQLLLPTFDYCIPNKECPNAGGAAAENPCEVFSQIDFPIDALFPSRNDTCIPPSQSCTGCARTE